MSIGGTGLDSTQPSSSSRAVKTRDDERRREGRKNPHVPRRQRLERRNRSRPGHGEQERSGDVTSNEVNVGEARVGVTQASR